MNDLRQGQLGDVFIEVGVGSFAKTIYRKARLLAQVNLIAVERKYLFLRKPRLEDHRHVSFGNFALAAFFSGDSKRFLTNCCVMLEPPCRAIGELGSES